MNIQKKGSRKSIAVAGREEKESNMNYIQTKIATVQMQHRNVQKKLYWNERRRKRNLKNSSSQLRQDADGLVTYLVWY